MSGISPCPARVTAVLGFERPTTIPCGLAAGHHGRHRYEITWDEDGPGGSTDGTDLDWPHPDITDRRPTGSLRERLGLR